MSMGFFSFFLGEKKKTATVAKERLQLILAHERNSTSDNADYLPKLQRELMAVIAKYVNVNPDDIKVQMDRQGNLEVLEVKIELSDTIKITAD
jgi:cell division topological specificity factor